MTTATVDIAFLTAAELGRAYRSGELKPTDVVRSLLARIERLQPTVRAYITVTGERAMAEAEAAERALAVGDTRPLLGVPMAYKDIYLTAGVRTTGGSALYEHHVPEMTATTIRLLSEAGAIFMGKVATHEFASGISPEDHPLPPARNPWNLERIPGGSSSGSGAALAAGLAMGALGSDTGGSIRHPGTACGIAALKPTYGRCSRVGVFPLSWSLDHTGPMARSCEDLALMLQALAGYDPLDPASIETPVDDYTATINDGVAGLKIGVMRSWYEAKTHPDVIAAVENAIGVLRDLGAEIVDVDIPNLELEKVLSIIMGAEAYAYHKHDLETRRELYPPVLRNRMLSGGLYSADEYIDAQRARDLVCRSVAATMKDVDILLSPTRGKTALTFPEAYGDYMGAVSFTGLFNLTGQPAISIPCGFGTDDMPIGLQLAGRPFAEATVLRAANAYESATTWHKRHPAL